MAARFPPRELVVNPAGWKENDMKARILLTGKLRDIGRILECLVVPLGPGLSPSEFRVVAIDSLRRAFLPLPLSQEEERELEEKVKALQEMPLEWWNAPSSGDSPELVAWIEFQAEKEDRRLEPPPQESAVHGPSATGKQPPPILLEKTTSTQEARGIVHLYREIAERGGHAAIDFREGEIVLQCTRPGDDTALWGRGAVPRTDSDEWVRICEA
jgi:hypothetical protein